MWPSHSLYLSILQPKKVVNPLQILTQGHLWGLKIDIWLDVRDGPDLDHFFMRREIILKKSPLFYSLDWFYADAHGIMEMEIDVVLSCVLSFIILCFFYLFSFVWSTNSAINSLWKKSILNSPSKLTVTTGDQEKKEKNSYKAGDYLDSTDPSLGETLVNDIESFVQKANTKEKNENNDVSLSPFFHG